MDRSLGSRDSGSAEPFDVPLGVRNRGHEPQGQFFSESLPNLGIYSCDREFRAGIVLKARDQPASPRFA
ncbi:hypothetical protein RE6C_03267 [Rhodopirellula europaea 6C]|uniref:Uncharacterized protein n=1 Tax=Rhodopirellula europaea 6C TaxID=1263867 RepID=M2B1D5_9BACT|nr:hypothetical protein RE6C_03267 [Rhodopirellula europaea 6C]